MSSNVLGGVILPIDAFPLLTITLFESGAFCTRLSPSALALGVFFCIADLVLISQCSYYNSFNARRRSERDESNTSAVEDPSEHDPLLHHHHQHPRRSRSDSTGLPGSHRRHSARRRESTLDPLTRIVTGEDETPDSNPWLHNTLSLLAVWLVGAVAWLISYKMGAWNVNDGLPDADDGYNTFSREPKVIIGSSLGYFSAICYLWYVSNSAVSALFFYFSLGVTIRLKEANQCCSARIPQIIKNYREKSCEGLALLFFLLSLTGNFTYGASVIAYSQQRDYVIRALPWLLGSLGTMVEDFIIFFQFRLYSPQRERKTHGTA